jgi:carbamoyl-phosphate synthase large subunit
MKVMVTGAGALLGQGILRELRDSSLEPHLIGVDPSPLSAGLYWCDEAALVPMARDAAYLPRIEELLQQYRPNALLVGTDVELEKLAEERHRLEETYGVHVVVASPEVIRIADDKYVTAKFFESLDMPAPRSVLRGEEMQLVEEIGFPLVVKPRVGARSYGVHLVHDVDELHRAIESLESPVIQECVGESGAEFTAGSLTFDGVCEAAIVMRRDLRDGNTYRAFAEPMPELEAQVRRWAEALGAHGPANFQFRLDADGVPKVFEINARFSGTTALRRHAGFPEVEMVLRHLVDGAPVVQPEIQPVTILRHWSETVVRPADLLS